MPYGSSSGSEVASTTWSQSPATDPVTHSHSASPVIRRRPSSSTRPLRESITTMRTAPPGGPNVRR